MGRIVWSLTGFTVLLNMTAVAAYGTERTASFPAAGVSCEAYAVVVQRALIRPHGVKAASVSYPTESAIVTFDDSKITPDQIQQVIATAGFQPVPSVRRLKGGVP